MGGGALDALDDTALGKVGREPGLIGQAGIAQGGSEDRLDPRILGAQCVELGVLIANHPPLIIFGRILAHPGAVVGKF